jgi:hypothetical protein
MMAKHGKGDCRNHQKRIEHPKAFSRMKWIAVPRGENRHERRAIGARFRHAYGKAAYLTMIENAKSAGILNAIKAFVENDAERYEEITGKKLVQRK